MTISRTVAHGLGVLGLVSALSACGDDVTPPPPPPPSPLVVSDPVPNGSSVSATRVSAPRGAALSIAAAEAGAGADVAYVSLVPNTYPTGESAVITNVGTGSTVSAPVVDGGLDPVPIPAVADDSLEIEILLATGATLAVRRETVPRNRRPAVVRTVPPRGKTDVAVNTNIVVVFSEPVDESTLSPSVQLFRGANAVSGTVRLLQGVTAAAVFQPAAPLDANTEYRLVVTDAVRDLDGDGLETPMTAEFTTGTRQEGPVAGLSLVPDVADVRVGTRFQLLVTAYDAQGNVLTGRPVIWTSDDPPVATVSATGLVTALAEGTAGILAEVEGWFIAILVRVSETISPVGSVTLTADSASVTPGGTLELRAEARDPDGNLLVRRLVVWTSSNPSVATVTQSATDRAVVTGVANGVARIVATIEGRSDTTVVTVGPPQPIVGLIVSPDTATLLLRATVQLTALTRNAAGARTPVEGTLVQWQTSDPAVVTIDGGGLVTAVGAGSATITATSSGFTATARVAVVQVTFATLSAGRAHSCAVASSGEAYCWGGNDFGQVGRPGLVGGSFILPAFVRLPTPVRVADGLTFIAASAGGFHSCGVTASGMAHCWGYNGEGALGNATFINSWRPVSVVGGFAFAMIHAGTRHTCGLTATGAAYCWGSNRAGQLGNGTLITSPSPVPVDGELEFGALSAGGSHTCALTREGLAYCWGENSSGQLGVGEAGPASKIPLAVAGGLTFAAISAGEGHTCGLASSGVMYCWGWNLDGQLGNERPFIPTAIPVAVTGGLAFQAIGVGASHTCAIDANGGAHCWGQNVNGRLGNGTTTEGVFSTPQPVVGGRTFTNLSVGRAHACALAADLAWYCWGQNITGSLGVGTMTDSGTPVKVLGQP